MDKKTGIKIKSIRKIADFMRQNKMTVPGDTLCVGLSGGADSVYLLLVLHALKEEFAFKLCAFHVNHLLRGEESDRDEEFAKRLCLDFNIPIRVFRYDVARFSAEEKLGTEEAGRILRKKAAEIMLREAGNGKIALAHQMDDCAETMIFHLARGAALKGMRGILPVGPGMIRPLLCMEKAAIEKELLEADVPWIKDSSNAADDYSRNKIRHHVIPYLSREINPMAVKHMNEAASVLRQTEEIISGLAKERERELLSFQSNTVLIKEEILAEKRVLAFTILSDALQSLVQTVKDITLEHLSSILGLFDCSTGSRIDLPYSLLAVRTYQGVYLQKIGIEAEKANRVCVPLLANAEWKAGEFTLKTSLLSRGDVPEKIPENRYTKCFDYDKINSNAFFRNPDPDDYLVIDREGNRQSLKKYLNSMKIPAFARQDLICLASGSRVFWIIGFRISEDCKITSTTKTVLKIEATGGKFRDGKN